MGLDMYINSYNETPSWDPFLEIYYYGKKFVKFKVLLLQIRCFQIRQTDTIELEQIVRSAFFPSWLERSNLRLQRSIWCFCSGEIKILQQSRRMESPPPVLMKVNIIYPLQISGWFFLLTRPSLGHGRNENHPLNGSH